MRRVAAVLGLSLALTGIGVYGVNAASPSEEECVADGGTFERIRGEVTCVIVVEGKNPRFTDEETTKGRGNTENKQEQSSECGGTGSGKCPPGQF